MMLGSPSYTARPCAARPSTRLLIAERAGGYAQRLMTTLTRRQMRIRATITVLRYIGVIAALIWLDVVYSDQAMWALSSLVIPLMLVFCYTQVRLQLGLEPLMQGNEPEPPSQAPNGNAPRSDA
jgi:hypothetical protein